jgi:inward rectifier potassium channel
LGDVFFHWSDIYHVLLTISWWQFLGLISLIYLLINILFAFAYLASENAIANAHPHSFIDAFSFSVQTMATIGYGAMYPNNLYAHILVTIEVLIGLLSLTMATSLMFARFSRPTARVLFSNVAVTCPYNTIPTLMFRVANLRNNWIVEAQVRVSLLLPEETSAEGSKMRRLYDLPLIRSESPFLALTWVIMHPINEDSPLFNLSEEIFVQGEYQLFITLTGLDATLSQTIYARHIYFSHEVKWNHRFIDVVKVRSDGSRYIEDDKFHDITPS